MDNKHTEAELQKIKDLMHSHKLWTELVSSAKRTNVTQIIEKNEITVIKIAVIEERLFELIPVDILKPLGL